MIICALYFFFLCYYKLPRGSVCYCSVIRQKREIGAAFSKNLPFNANASLSPLIITVDEHENGTTAPVTAITSPSSMDIDKSRLKSTFDSYSHLDTGSINLKSSVEKDKLIALPTATATPTTASSTSLTGDLRASLLDKSHAYSKKAQAVLFVVLFGLAIGLIINFVNLHTDFQDLQDFYRGYMGRRMLISEGKLTSRQYLRALKTLQEEHERERNSKARSSSASLSGNHIISNGRHAITKNNHNDVGQLSLQTIQEEMKRMNPHCHSHFSAYFRPKPFEGLQPLGGRDDQLDWLQRHLPLYASTYIEDQDPEWRDLDYSIDVGPPPTSLCQFIRQYDWRIYACDRDDDDDGDGREESHLTRRRHLFYQFRKWKKRRRKLWTIVVTERAKKEMAEQDQGIGAPRR